MSRIKATVRFLHAWRHPDEIAREVEAELRSHIEMRTRANIEGGMKPAEAQLAARRSFGDFDRVKTKCCDISRSLPFDSTLLKMAMYITIAVLAGGVALWAVNMPHHSFTGVLWQLVAIVVLARSFVVGRRAISTKQFQGDRASDVFDDETLRRDKGFSSDVCEAHSAGIAAHDEKGRTPVERMFN
ncbi:MAG TPA: permease prefix domain 1-containing protein [Pyrinomonadaceae bacterium]|nr:permease prefix domain 1-containing protein [Pyrinomonadaceae bacterium]